MFETRGGYDAKISLRSEPVIRTLEQEGVE